MKKYLIDIIFGCSAFIVIGIFTILIISEISTPVSDYVPCLRPVRIQKGLK